MTEKTLELIRRDPPPIRHRNGSRGEWSRLYEVLRRDPGAWHLVDKPYKDAASASSTASYIKKKYPGLETKVRSHDDNAYLYVRFVEAS